MFPNQLPILVPNLIQNMIPNTIPNKILNRVLNLIPNLFLNMIQYQIPNLFQIWFQPCFQIYFQTWSKIWFQTSGLQIWFYIWFQIWFQFWFFFAIWFWTFGHCLLRLIWMMWTIVTFCSALASSTRGSGRRNRSVGSANKRKLNPNSAQVRFANFPCSFFFFWGTTNLVMGLLFCLLKGEWTLSVGVSHPSCFFLFCFFFFKKKRQSNPLFRGGGLGQALLIWFFSQNTPSFLYGFVAKALLNLRGFKAFTRKVVFVWDVVSAAFLPLIKRFKWYGYLQD